MKEDWKYKKLGEVASYINGYPFKPSDWCNQGMPIIRIQNLTGSQDNYNRCLREDIPSKYIVKDGDILISWSATLGVYEWTKENALLNQHIFKVVFDKCDINKLFFKYAIMSSIEEMSKHTNGATMRHIRKGDFDNIIIPIPSLLEQQKIVERLDAAFENIDKLKANAEKQLAEAKTLFQKSLAKAMEPKEEWKVVKLESLCTDVVDCPHSTPRKAEHPTQYPCIRTSELKGGNIEWSSMQYLEEEEYIVRTARIKPQCNDIVYGREGTYGDAVLLPEGYFFSLGQRTMLFRPNIGKVVPKFLHYNVISSHVYEQAKAKNSGCGVGHVNVKDIKLFDIGIPKSLAEQQRIVERLDALSENIRKYEEIQRQIISECDALKQALLRKVFE